MNPWSLGRPIIINYLLFLLFFMDYTQCVIVSISVSVVVFRALGAVIPELDQVLNAYTCILETASLINLVGLLLGDLSLKSSLGLNNK